MKIRTGPILGTLLGAASLAGVSQFLWPPIGYYLDENGHTLFDVALRLLNPFDSEIYDYPFAGWAFIIAFIITVVWLLSLVRSILQYIEVSRVPISIIETNVVIDIQDNNGCDAIYRRDQIFHANRKRIKAYQLQFKADAVDGSMDRESLNQNSTLNNESVTENIVVWGSDRDLSIMERFNRALPTNFFATYLPNGVVYWLYKHDFMEKVVVSRKGSIRYKNECSGQHCVMAVNASVSPITAITMTVMFPENSSPTEETIRCYLTHVNACDDVHLERLTAEVDASVPPGKVAYRARKRGLFHRKMLILWENPAAQN